MGIFSYVKLGKKIFGKQKTTGETINPFKPNKQTYSSKLKIDLAKTPGKVQRQFMPIMRDIDKTGRSLRQTNQKLKREPVTESGFTKGKNLRDKKMGGGMMGRRMGYRIGTPKPKTNVQKIKETFSPKGKNLKPVDPKKQKGLAKLPKQVRNKMGYMKSGGRA
jgi:hypothetical protein